MRRKAARPAAGDCGAIRRPPRAAGAGAWGRPGLQPMMGSSLPLELLNLSLALPVFALVLARLSGLFLTAPFFASPVAPVRVRVAMLVSLAWLMYPLVAGRAPTAITLAQAAQGMVAELLVGVAIGLSMGTLVAGIQIGGLMAGQQAGLALSQVFDPSVNEETSVVGQLYSIAALTLFLLVGGHRAILAALLDTFDAVPLMSFSLDESPVLLLVETMTSAFLLAIRLAGPVLIALMLLTLALGLLSRTIPQLNVLSVGFNLKNVILLGAGGLSIRAAQDVVLECLMDGLDLARAVLIPPA